MIYVIKESDIFKQYAHFPCACCGSTIEVNFHEDLDRVTDLDVGRLMIRDNTGNWKAEAHTAFKERIENGK